MSLFIVEVKHKTHKGYVPYVPDGYTEPIVYTSAQEAHAAAEKSVKEMENPASEYKARVSKVHFRGKD